MLLLMKLSILILVLSTILARAGGLLEPAALPAAAEDTPLDSVAAGLTRIGEGMKPVASVVQDGRAVTLSFNTRTFMVHSSDKLGHRSAKAHQSVGPRYDGLIVKVTQQEGRYFGAAVIPQNLRRPYWTTYVNAYPIAQGRQHLHVNIEYGNRTDRKVIKQVKALLESIIDDDPKIEAKQPGAHNRTLERKSVASHKGEGKTTESPRTRAFGSVQGRHRHGGEVARIRRPERASASGRFS